MRALVLHPVLKGPGETRNPQDALAEAESLARALDLDVVEAVHPDIKVKSFRYPVEWLRQNFREDVAEFLHGLPWGGDLQSLIPKDDFEKSKLYVDKLREGRDFYHGQYFNNKLLRLIKKQELLRRLLRNSLTTSLYRRFVKKAVDGVAQESICRLS